MGSPQNSIQLKTIVSINNTECCYNRSILTAQNYVAILKAKVIITNIPEQCLAHHVSQTAAIIPQHFINKNAHVNQSICKHC